MQNELIQQGISLMLYGMGTVFVFLAILVLVTFSMSAIVKRFFPEVESLTPATNSINPGTAAQPQAVDPKRLAVISAAIKKHRETTGR
ncbi:MAG: OadG family protein [Cellvibrionales bacterium]|nr:OadG family protein [Cellvibrionales bacterium]